MKYIVVILLLSTNGIDIEKVKLKHNGNCDGIANERNGDPKLQGHYTADGELLLGWTCD